MLCLPSHVLRSYNHFVRLTVLGQHCNQVALRSCSGTWHQKPARPRRCWGHLSSAVWMWIRVADPKFWRKMSPQKAPKGNLMNIIRLPTPIFGNYVIGQMSNIYVGAVRGMFCHPTVQAARVTNCLKHSRGNHQSSSSEVYLHFIRPGKFLPIIHPLQLGST